MNKFKLFVLPLTFTVLALAIFGCSIDEANEQNGQNQQSHQNYEDMIFPGVADDRDVETAIRTIFRTELAPQTGDSYVMRFVDTGQVISRGILVVSPYPAGFYLAFHPEGNGTVFYGSLAASGALTASSVPAPGGNAIDIRPPGSGRDWWWDIRNGSNNGDSDNGGTDTDGTDTEIDITWD